MSFIGLPSIVHRLKWNMPSVIVVINAPIISGTNIVPAGTFWSDFQMFTFFFSDSITLAPTFDFAFLSFFVPFLSRYAHYYTRHA